MNRTLRNKMGYTVSDKNVRDAGITTGANTDLMGTEGYPLVTAQSASDAFGVNILVNSDYDCMEPNHETRDYDFGTL